MTKNRIAKFAAVAVGMTFAFGAVATPAAAQSIADLQAQINALLAQLSALQGGNQSGASVTFTRDLTLGSTGADVQALQSFLMSRGFSIPNGPTTYFGPQTRAAVAAYQAANGIAPAAGYFGPVTRARVNAAGGVTGPTTPTTPGGGITTPGVEGSLTASLNPTPTNGTRVYGGDNRAGVLGIRLEARLSDVRVERVTVQLPSTSFYNRIANRVYLLDGSTVVGSADLNSNTVVRDGSDYVVNITGVNYIVPRNSTRVLTVAFDIYSNVSGQTTAPHTISIPTNGVRGVDGAGLNLTTPNSPLSRSFDLRDELATEANIRVSLNTNSPISSSVVASEGSENDEIDNLEVLRFDVRAERDAVEIIDLVAGVNVTGTGAVTTVYLYEGSSLIGSDVISTSTNQVTFSNIDYVIPRDTTRTLSLRVDVRDATTTPTVISATTTTETYFAENSLGDVLVTNELRGSAEGSEISVISAGPEVTLVSSPTITKSTTQTGTSTAQATFNIRVRALGDDVALGNTGAFDFKVFIGGGTSSTTSGYVVSYSAPSSGVVNVAGGFRIPEGNSVTIPVDVIYTVGPDEATNTYAVGLENVVWGFGSTTTGENTNFMAGRTEWRTPNIVLP